MTDSNGVSGYHDIITGVSDPARMAAGAAQISPSSTPDTSGLLKLAVGVVVVVALYFGRDVLIPFTLSVLLSFVLSPLVIRLERLGLWRAPAVGITMIIALGIIGAIGTLIGTQAASLSGDAPRYARTIEAKFEKAQLFATGEMAALTRYIGPGLRHTPTADGQKTPQPSARQDAQAPRPIPVEVTNEKSSPLAVVWSIVAPVLSPLETIALVFIVAIFILMQKEDLRDRMIRLFGSSDLHRTTLAMDDAGQRLSRYFLSQLAVNTAFGCVIGLGTWLIGVPAPALWGILAGLLRFVPYIGSLLAALAPVALAAAVDPGWSMALYVALLFLIVEPLTGYLIEPLLYGHSTGLSPVSVIVAAIFWTWLWGPVGLVMSTPLTLTLVVLGRHVKSLEFFDVMLGDRPALTPVESFYQRILAGNPDEALAQAESFIANGSLVEYYDEVVMPGLQLATEDQARGTINARRSNDMSHTVEIISEEFDDMLDTVAVLATPATLLCIPGHGAFDAVASRLAVQTLRHQGIATRAIESPALSREAITNIDLSGIDTVIIISLLPEKSEIFRRRLTRGLRMRGPALHILSGPVPEVKSGPGITNESGNHSDKYFASLAQLARALAGRRRNPQILF